LKQFKIPFKGLSLGSHLFDWDIDKKFFEAFENPDVLDCSLTVKLNLEKQERMMILDLSFMGSLEVACDRCLENFDLPVTINERYYIKFGEERKEESEDILVIPESDYQLDVAPLLFDYITLAMPIKKVHPENENGVSMCNSEILSMLENNKDKTKTDPRWEALKKLKTENNK